MGREAVILKLNPYDLHGVRYYQMYLSYRDAPDRVQEIRLPHDNVYAEPAEGDYVEVEMLLSMVTAVSKKEPPVAQ
jgi:hypothetical protein